MALISSNPAVSETARLRLGRTTSTSTSAGIRRPAPMDQVRFSHQTSQQSSRDIITRVILGGGERQTHEIEPDAFLQAGKEEYLDSSGKDPDVSPDATASRILGGITGYIFGAFRLQNPQATAEDFDIFSEQISQGFERGLGEAKEILEALSAMDEELATAIEQTEDIVRTGLEQFFTEQRKAYGPISTNDVSLAQVA